MTIGGNYFLTAALMLADGWDMHDGDFGGWWIVMGIGMILFWALVIVGIVWLVRVVVSDRRLSPTGAKGDDPLEILDRRLAEGDLTIEEYGERRAALTSRRGS